VPIPLDELADVWDRYYVDAGVDTALQDKHFFRLEVDALLRAVESFDALRNPAALNSWMQVIVTRSVARRVRIVRRKRALTAGDSDPEYLPCRAPLPDFQVDLRRLLDTLGGLPEEERRCFWLRRCEGLRIEEIARETALSPSTIHRRLNGAERRLAKRLREPELASPQSP
jgi:RNA polymerase sigma factor (sigma-70 family)